MEWFDNFKQHSHKLFVTFIELKIEGTWNRYEKSIDLDRIVKYEIAQAAHDANCLVTLIEPDGLKKILHFTINSTLSIHNNLLAYNPDEVEEIAIDEKEQMGKGKTRDTLV